MNPTLSALDLTHGAPAGAETVPTLSPHLKPPTILGNGALFRFAVNGGDLDKVSSFFAGQPGDAAALLDLALVHLLQRRSAEAYAIQRQALARQQVFRVVGTAGKEAPVRRRVLAFVAPGDFTNNAQLEFLLDGGDTGLDVVYLMPGQPLPAVLPDHDVAFCAVNESEENLPLLRRLARLARAWPRPVLNVPENVAQLSRDGVAALLQDVPGLCAPGVRRVGPDELARAAADSAARDAWGVAYPLLVRPIDSHGGRNLARIDGRAALAAYLQDLEKMPAGFFLTPFLDYRSPDGLFRKYRLIFFEGAPFLCHLAISSHWMIHYVNAGMADDDAKRAEEARAMETGDFARRHAAALTALHARLGLDYVIADCGELPDGRLLLFEADTAMVVHATDSPTLYPYKQGQMARVFDAFRTMIDRAAARPSGLPAR
ncbi:MAG: RimK family alpha-L-glutamate ligase [Verrucomicrobiota bacterium]